jgi:hypothetical protein
VTWQLVHRPHPEQGYRACMGMQRLARQPDSNRAQMHMLTVAHSRSSFVLELVKEHGLEIRSLDGDEVYARICQRCQKSSLVPRSGPYGTFSACNRFTACDYRENFGRRSGSGKW